MKPLDNAILIDENGFKIDIVAIDDYGNAYSLELNEGEGLITEGVEIAAFMNKPQWNGSEWIETEHLPPQEPVEPPENKMEVLEKQVKELTQENKLLHAQVEALSAEGEFKDELIAEMAMVVYA